MLPVYENLGNAYIDAGKFSLAISLHKDLLSKDSTNIRHHINLGDAYMKNKDTTQAQLYFLKAVDLNPHSTLAHVNLAMTYFYQTKYKEAIDDLFLVRNMDNWYPLLQNRLEVVTATAQSEFEQWVEREPANSEALYYLAFSVWYRDDCEDALDEMEEIIELNDQVEKYYLTLKMC